MGDTLELSTPDPRFDPDKPVKVNGYLYLPAKRVLAGKRPVVEPRRERKAVVEIKRRRELVSP